MYQATGDIAGRVFSTASAAIAIRSDPHLPEVLCQVEKLVPPSEKPFTATDVVSITTDPHLQELACQVLRLQGIEQGTPVEKLPQCKQIPISYKRGTGIGLRYVVGPLRYLVAARENPALAAVVIAAGVGGLIAIGYSLGKGK